MVPRPTYGLFRAHSAQDELVRPPCGRDIEYIRKEDNVDRRTCLSFYIVIYAISRPHGGLTSSSISGPCFVRFTLCVLLVSVPVSFSFQALVLAEGARRLKISMAAT